MVLDHVADGARLFVVVAAPLDAKGLSHRDLHVVDVAPVPDRLEDAVAKPQHHDVLNGLFAQVMVDAIDLLLRETFGQRGVQRLGRVVVMAKRLLDDDAREAGAFRFAALRHPRFMKQLADHRIEGRRRRQIEETVALGAPLAI